MKFTDEEIAAILASLRLMQRTEVIPLPIHDIYTDGDRFVGLSIEDIDDLCERINCGGW